MNKDYNLLSRALEVLQDYPMNQIDEKFVEKTFKTINHVFELFGLNVERLNFQEENHFVRYYFTSEKYEELEKTLKLYDDVCVALDTKDVRAYCDKNQNTVCFEVPKKDFNVIGAKKLFEKMTDSDEALKALIGISNDHLIYHDFCKNPNLLIAGNMGSGKTVLINQMVLSVVSRYSLENIKIALIDPKQVEFEYFSGLPHLANGKIIRDIEEIFSYIKALCKEAEDNLKLFEQNGVPDIDEYNKKAREQGLPIKQKTVVIFDEFADIIISNHVRYEKLLKTLIRKGGKSGVYLVLSTQCPTKDILSFDGNKKFSRVCLRVSTITNSKNVLGVHGAERLIGKGDLLYLQEDGSVLRGASSFISTKEIKEVVNLIK